MLRLLTVLALCLAAPARADEDRAGAFDYYVLALSWSPSWCAAEGDARGADQCDPRHDHGFTLHGLWPQYERGWPDWCRSPHRDPSRGQTGAMADIMGSSGLAWHQWKKHGRCSGLSADDYFAAARAAYLSVVRPELFRNLPRTVTIPPSVIEEAFLEANPALGPDMLTVTCRDGRLREVRVCLTRDTLAPRDCAPDIRRDCAAGAIEMDPIR